MTLSNHLVFVALLSLCGGCGIVSEVAGPKQEAILEDVAEEFIRDEIKGVPQTSAR